MEDRKLYRQKRKAQLKEWEADLDKLKARASKASADAQLKLNQRIAQLEEQVDQGRKMLGDLKKAGEDAFQSAKKRVDEAWSSLRAGFEDAREESDATDADRPG